MVSLLAGYPTPDYSVSAPARGGARANPQSEPSDEACADCQRDGARSGGDGLKSADVERGGDGLSVEERRAVQALAKTDRHVRAHEQAHMAAAGGYATGGASFQYVTGPDGRRYAVAGEVSIDTAPVPGDPQATIRKAKTIQAAANAPVDPSAQDRQVAAAATRMELEATQEMIELQQATQGSEQSSTTGVNPTGDEPSPMQAYQQAERPEIGLLFSLIG